MFKFLRSRIPVTTFVVFSVTILGLMSVQNMLLYNTVEHETFRFSNNDRGENIEKAKDNLDTEQTSHDALKLREKIEIEAKNDYEEQRARGVNPDSDQVNQDQVSEEKVDFNPDQRGEEKVEFNPDQRGEEKVDFNPDQINRQQNDVNPDRINEEKTGLNPDQGSKQDSFSSKKPERRKNLIIIGLSRSGTSYMCHMFNQDPNVFNIYEPMQMLTHWDETDHLKFNYKQVSTDMINAIMRCNYTENDFRRKFVLDFSTFWRYRIQSNAFSSPPFCNISYAMETCSVMRPEILEKVCLNNYKHTVVKLTYSRLPEEGKIQTLIPILLQNPDVDIRILHFVRDPRGNYNSRIKLGWIRDYPNPAIANDAKKICGIVERNIEYGNNLTGELKEKYKVVRYVDMFTEPLKTAQDIYDFAGFHLPESVKDWIVKTTAPSPEEVERMKKNPLALVRNSRENVEKWKKDAPPGRTKVLEQSCQRLIKLMGHNFVFPPE